MDPTGLLAELLTNEGGRAALLDCAGGREVTFATLHERAVATAAALRERGLERGARICMLANNSLELAVLCFGAMYAGVVTVPVNPGYRPEDVAYFLEHSGASVLVVSPDCMDLVPELERSVSLLMLPGPGELPVGTEPFDPFALSSAGTEAPALKADDWLTIVYTSGTTARPKGVIHTVGNLLGNARTFGAELGIGSENRFYGILPMTYLGGYYNLLLLPWANGASVAVARALDASAIIDFWGPAQRTDVNTLWMVPTIMSMLMRIDRSADGPRWAGEHVRLGLVGTAPLRGDLKGGFESRYGVRLYENYGLSETLFLATQSPETPNVEGSVGRVLPPAQLAVHDESGAALRYGEQGELLARTPYRMVGYYDPQKPAGPSDDRLGWFPTGDLGRIAATGDVFITGREKDLIIRGGVNVSPKAVEEIVVGHPAVEDVIVVGLPHEVLGEEIVAVVRLAPGHSFSEELESLREHARANLGPMRQVSRFLEIDDWPLGPTGKVLRDAVKAIVTSKLAAAPAGVARAKEDTIGGDPRLGGRIRRSCERPSPEAVAALATFPASIISDVLDRLGCMDGRIGPLTSGASLCGPAFTVEEVEGGNLMSHKALELVAPGDVLVIDAKGCTTRACWGGIQTLAAAVRGVAGIVIDGAVRDADDLAETGVPLFAVGVSPAGPLKGWGGNINFPVSCGGVPVLPGDVIRGDGDGVVVVPRQLAARVAELCAQRAAIEEEWTERVRHGESTTAILGLEEKLRQARVTYED